MTQNLKDQNRGVSPVIGVILMVAITVILAAVIGTFVLDLGNNAVQQNPQAGISIEQTKAEDGSSGAKVDVTVMSIQQAESVTTKVVENSGAASPNYSPSGAGQITGADSTTDVGDIQTISGLEKGDKVIVTASYKGNSVVISSQTI